MQINYSQIETTHWPTGASCLASLRLVRTQFPLTDRQHRKFLIQGH